MVDVHEAPAVSPERVGGDERLGFIIAGILLIVVGTGIGILFNLYVHATASPTGSGFGPWVVTPAIGTYAWATIGLGIFASLAGIGILWVSRRAPKGPIALPGEPL